MTNKFPFGFILEKTIFAVSILAICLFACTKSDSGRGYDNGSGLRVEINTSPFSLTIRDPDGKTLLRSGPLQAPVGVSLEEVTDAYINLGFSFFSLKPGVWTYADEAEIISTSPELIDAKIRGSDDLLLSLKITSPGAGLLSLSIVKEGGLESNRIAQVFECTQDEHFFGMGERFDSVDQRGRVVPIWTDEGAIGTGKGIESTLFPKGELSTYLPVPLFLNSRGYALVLDTKRRSIFDLCATSKDLFRVEVWDNRLDYTLAYGATPADIIERLTSYTGRHTLPKPFVFGPWNDAVMGEAHVLEVVKTIRENNIPSSIIWTEDWAGGSSAGPQYLVEAGTKPYTTLYPDLRSLADEVHAKGFRFIGYFYPWINTKDTERFQEGLEKGYYALDPNGEPCIQFVVGGSGAVIDLTNPAARQWVKGFFQEAVDLGFDGWMADFAESVPFDAVFADGRTGADVHNDYPLLWQQVNREFWDSLREDGDYLFFCRSGYTGTQRYAIAYFAGDQNTTWEMLDGLPAVIPAGMSAGISGAAYWGSDIAGYGNQFNGPSTKELFFRWTEFGAFSPIMRTHHGMMAADNWSFDRDAETLEHFGKYARLRAALFPYLYAAAKETAETGMPMMRHLYLHFPDDSEVAGINDEYMLGPFLLVAPVIEEGAVSRSVYLPEGEWYPIGKAETLSGKGRVDVQASVEEIPVFVRAGAIIPRLSQPPDTFVIGDNRIQDSILTLEEVQDQLDIEVYLGGDAEIELADGTTFKLKSSSTNLPEGLKLNNTKISACDTPEQTNCIHEDQGSILKVSIDNHSFDLAGSSFHLNTNDPTESKKYKVILFGSE